MSSNAFRVLGLVPARGGSKGVPRKNVRLLDGRPLLHYTADAARGSARLAHVILSTDDDEIARVGRACGLDVPFMRPAELAGDTAPMLPVIQHALRWFDERGTTFDAVCLLQPTHPLRKPSDIDRCVAALERSDADCVMTMVPVPAEHNPHWVYFTTADGTLQLSTGEATPIARRQDLPPAFHREGSVYVSRRDAVLNGSLYGRRTMGVVVDAKDSVNIDEPTDWAIAEAQLTQRRERKGRP
jgi:CMP-N,N'-diacetyllegionaminic acid synthase